LQVFDPQFLLLVGAGCFWIVVVVGKPEVVAVEGNIDVFGESIDQPEDFG
jgi:hypothetical protein